MDLAELADVSGEDIGTLRRYRSLGLLADADDYGFADGERVRLLQLLSRRGISPDAVAGVLPQQLDLFDRYLEQVYPGGDYPSVPLDEAAARTGLDPDLVQRVRDAGALGGARDLLSGEDVDALTTIAIALDSGLPEEALLQLVRVYADALGRVGEAEARLFHFYVHGRLRAEGLSGEALDGATNLAVERLLQLAEPTVLYFHPGLGESCTR